MRKWLRRIRGAVGMGVTWAVGWALVVVLMGVTTILLPSTGLEVIFEAADDELLMMMLPAFAGGVVFSTVLGIGGRRRRFDELSLPQFAAWGGDRWSVAEPVPGCRGRCGGGGVWLRLPQ